MRRVERGRVIVTAERIEKFCDHIYLDPEGCWEWLDAVAQNGYGRFTLTGRPDGQKTIAAHRFAWLWLVGPIEDDLVLDHLCRNRGCCNPAHLEPVTQQENVRRGLQIGLKTHCKHGHVYVPVKHGRNDWCLECKRLHDQKWGETRKRQGWARGDVTPRKFKTRKADSDGQTV